MTAVVRPPLGPALTYSTCTLCRRPSTSGRTVYLNNQPVCRSCRSAFASRRQAAFIVDWVLLVAIPSLGIPYLLSLQGSTPEMIAETLFILLSWLPRFMLILKDSINGMSPGKWLLDLQAVDYATREPIGPLQSLKRDLPLLIPYIGVLGINWHLIRGRRWGDRWARTVVIRRKDTHKPPFAPSGFFCLACGYNLTGNVSGRCPECGTDIPEPMRRQIVSGDAPF